MRAELHAKAERRGLPRPTDAQWKWLLEETGCSEDNISVDIDVDDLLISYEAAETYPARSSRQVAAQESACILEAPSVPPHWEAHSAEVLAQYQDLQRRALSAVERVEMDGFDGEDGGPPRELEGSAFVPVHTLKKFLNDLQKRETAIGPLDDLMYPDSESSSGWGLVTIYRGSHTRPWSGQPRELPAKNGLWKVKQLATQLCADTGLWEGQAVGFLLCNEPTMLPRLRIDPYLPDSPRAMPSDLHFTITVSSPLVGPDEVSRFYANVRAAAYRSALQGTGGAVCREDLNAADRGPNVWTLRLLEFKQHSPTNRWLARYQAWNHLYPDHEYKSAEAFRRSYRVARERWS